MKKPRKTKQRKRGNRRKERGWVGRGIKAVIEKQWMSVIIFH